MMMVLLVMLLHLHVGRIGNLLCFLSLGGLIGSERRVLLLFLRLLLRKRCSLLLLRLLWSQSLLLIISRLLGHLSNRLGNLSLRVVMFLNLSFLVVLGMLMVFLMLMSSLDSCSMLLLLMVSSSSIITMSSVSNGSMGSVSSRFSRSSRISVSTVTLMRVMLLMAVMLFVTLMVAVLFVSMNFTFFLGGLVSRMLMMLVLNQEVVGSSNNASFDELPRSISIVNESIDWIKALHPLLLLVLLLTLGLHLFNFFLLKFLDFLFICFRFLLSNRSESR
mmetsp:Transcript_37059/g.56850  ORF Transcript_37059/g.56850 Transcript_37059/m.56850 type:complete len:276 (-) Transcript_37059:418-1245(-)